MPSRLGPRIPGRPLPYSVPERSNPRRRPLCHFGEVVRTLLGSVIGRTDMCHPRTVSDVESSSSHQQTILSPRPTLTVPDWTPDTTESHLLRSSTRPGSTLRSHTENKRVTEDKYKCSPPTRRSPRTGVDLIVENDHRHSLPPHCHTMGRTPSLSHSPMVTPPKRPPYPFSHWGPFLWTNRPTRKGDPQKQRHKFTGFLLRGPVVHPVPKQTGVRRPALALGPVECVEWSDRGGRDVGWKGKTGRPDRPTKGLLFWALTTDPWVTGRVESDRSGFSPTPQPNPLVPSVWGPEQTWSQHK